LKYFLNGEDTGMKKLGQYFSVLMLAMALLGSANANDATKPATLPATHKQTQMFKPMRDGKPAHLNTFCLDKDGNLLTCVSSSQDGKGTLQVYSAELKLLKEIELPFVGTAINVAPDSSIFVAGNGKMAKISAAGELSEAVDTPNIGDRDSLKERLTKLAEENWAQYEQAMKSQVDMIQERIAKIEEKAEEDRSARDKKRLVTLQEQKKVYEDSMTQSKEYMTNPDQLMSNAFGITSLAVNSKDLYISCQGIETQGYEIWRMNHDFSEPSRVLSGQGGCCGQFDIQADDEHLILAENTKFKVGLYDRDGKRVSDFGQSNRMGGDGFGSCCNPMNVRCCGNGEILTAESSIGTIKRYNKEGKLLSVVGKAKIGGGCKHVPIGYDSSRDRYYIQYQDRNAICVLLPLSEAPEFTADELLAKEARQGLGAKLVGKWSLDGKLPKTKPQPAAATEEGEEALVDSDANSDPFLMPLMDFQESGKLTTTQSESTWECVKQADGSLFAAFGQEGVTYDLKVEFVGDDEISISVLFGDQAYSTKTYKRVTEAETPIKAESAESSSQTNGGGQ
jgi:hypothetical protein